MASNIKINFNSITFNNDILEIQDSNTPTTQIYLKYSLIVGDIPISGTISQNVQDTFNYIQLNYNSSNRYNVVADYTLGSESITITDNIGNSNFSVVQNTTSGRLSTDIVNDPVVTPISITDITLVENASPCSLVDIQVTTNQQATNLTSPVVQAISTNPFTITNINRDSINDIVITLNDADTSATQSIYVPIINSSIFDVQINLNPNGGSVNVIWLGTKQPLFDLLYSIDNVNFYSSTSFSGLSVGNYTMYIKDDIGCNTSIPFEITAFEPNVYVREPLFETSQQNSLITVKREAIDDITIFKNVTNTLSYEEDTEINNRNFLQLYKKTDGIIKQQFRTTYETPTAKLIDCDGVETVLTVEKKTTNIGVKDLRDTTLIKADYLNVEFVGVQYVSGKTYDPDTEVENGDYYLGNAVPTFMNVDDYVGYGAFWYRVKDIVVINNIQTLILDILVSNFPVSIPDNGTVQIAQTVYNAENYEVYETSFDCNTLEGNYYLLYEATDSEFDTVKQQTELFNVSEEQEKTYMLQYYNSVNNEMNYATGIRNKIRIPYEKTLTYQPNKEQENYKTDTNIVQVESTFNSDYTLEAEQAPQGMATKLALILTNDRLFLNGLSLVGGDVEQERVDLTNEYTMILGFNRSDYVFSSISEDGSIVQPSGQALGSDDVKTAVIGVKDN